MTAIAALWLALLFGAIAAAGIAMRARRRTLIERTAHPHRRRRAQIIPFPDRRRSQR